jgi:hypothetical protein
MEKMELNISIAIDDVHPKPGWRILGDQTEIWLRKLNDQFGVKFTLFIPSNYHREYPISKHLSWMDELLEIPWIEVAAHGHYHDTTDPKRFGECEFAELDPIVAKQRLDEMFIEWMAVGYIPKGWRTPGWLITQDNATLIGNNFNYVAAHYEHNRNIDWAKAKVLFGHSGIQVEMIDLINDTIMYTSHIAGNWNHNVWNQDNYDQLEISLNHLFENHTITPKFLKEC